MKLRFTPSADRDLDGLYEYIAQDSLEAAGAVVDRIFSALDRLPAYPKLGHRGRLPGTRELVIKGTAYIVLYRIETAVIRILRIWHSAQHWPRAG